MRHSPLLTDGHQLRLIEGGDDYFQRLIAAIDGTSEGAAPDTVRLPMRLIVRGSTAAPRA